VQWIFRVSVVTLALSNALSNAYGSLHAQTDHIRFDIRPWRRWPIPSSVCDSAFGQQAD
jgi:hypothetical protein